MPKNRFLSLTAFSLGCFSCVMLLQTRIQRPHAQRGPASLLTAADLVKYPSSKVNVQKIVRLNEQRRNNSFTKTKKPIEISIQTDIDKIQVGEPFTLRAEVSTSQEFQQAQFKWVMGNQFEVVSGSVVGALNGLNQEKKVIELTVRTSSDKPGNLFLHVFDDSTGVKLGGSGHFNTAKYVDQPTALSQKKNVVKIPVKTVFY